ncbi:uncharacterized protein KGF55_003044 [Candida pseudojiufengensis]|uniref:uncharacterized protein n=1 Tax=Candida pseudojiufengensis TaxID=497109 RepID=UPI002224228C|nr:uncharacterized protein KGF55_003044 [Candida pseudojiufengensis]KAI5963252.1 hypothetical protein KGF55_003044 [Candida pseudojiufengensis]
MLAISHFIILVLCFMNFIDAAPAPAIVTVWQTITSNIVTPTAPTTTPVALAAQQPSTPTTAASTPSSTGSFWDTLIDSLGSASTSPSSGSNSFSSWLNGLLNGNSGSSTSNTPATTSSSSSTGSSFWDQLQNLFAGTSQSQPAASTPSASNVGTTAADLVPVVSNTPIASQVVPTTTSSSTLLTLPTTSSSSSSSPVSQPSSSTSSSNDLYAAIASSPDVDSSFASDMIDLHKKYRAIHQAGPLKWDVNLYEYAKNNADNYDCSGVLTHTHGPYGENLAAGFKGAQDTFMVENGFRKIIPYYTTYQTHAKERWVGKTLTQIYSSEFGESEENILQDISENRLYVINNVGLTKSSSTIKGLDLLKFRETHIKDVIHHLKHNHEPLIPWVGPIPIIFENDEILVVDKPSGVPTHPSGSYLYNSLSETIKKELNMKTIKTCHRLDIGTSGILILCKTAESAVKYSNILLDKRGRVTKTYLARVKGKFSEGINKYTCPIFVVNMNGYLAPGDIARLPTNSTTIFERIRYNQNLDESIVKCIPVTGKFHQIRIHLRNLGYGISNDYYYNPEKALGDTYIEKSDIERALYDCIFKKFPQFSNFTESSDLSPSTINLRDILTWKVNTNLIDRLQSLKQNHSKVLLEKRSSKCPTCLRPIFHEDSIRDSKLYLHALSFECDDDKYQTDLPVWADI